MYKYFGKTKPEVLEADERVNEEDVEMAQGQPFAFY